MPDFAGPEVMTAEEMAETWLSVSGYSKQLINLPAWGKVARGFRNGKVTNPERAVGEVSWKDWLQQVK